MSGTVPDDITYTDLTAAQVAFLQQTVVDDARRKGWTATITVTPQAGGLMTAAIHFTVGVTPPAMAAVPGSPALAPTAGTALPAAAVAVPGAPAVQAANTTTPAQIDFAAGGLPLAQSDLDQAVTDLNGIDPNLIWALVKKESPLLCGYFSSRKPLILYERHIFSKQTGGRFDKDHPDISGPRYTAYGSYDEQYVRLAEAMALDSKAGLEACSWGLAQVLGENATDVSFADAPAMVAQMVKSEGAQLQAMVAFVKKHNLATPLRNQQWDQFSNTYNGGANPQYAGLLRDDYEYYKTNGAPAIDVRAAQLLLNYLGYSLTVDGLKATHTANAIMQFQRMSGLPQTGQLDSTTAGMLSAKALASRTS